MRPACTTPARNRVRNHDAEIFFFAGRLIFLVLGIVSLTVVHAANPRDGLRQLIAQLQTNAGNMTLREKIIKLVKTWIEQVNNGQGDLCSRPCYVLQN